jgi:hypothetical protein
MQKTIIDWGRHWGCEYLRTIIHQIDCKTMVSLLNEMHDSRFICCLIHNCCHDILMCTTLIVSCDVYTNECKRLSKVTTPYHTYKCRFLNFCDLLDLEQPKMIFVIHVWSKIDWHLFFSFLFKHILRFMIL